MHYVSFGELKETEDGRDGRGERLSHRGLLGELRLRGSTLNTRAGENPYFKEKWINNRIDNSNKERHAAAELIRAKDFMKTGEADKFRKVAAL